jgi:hypothetical protein
MDLKTVLDALEKRLPEVFGRSAVNELMPGIITDKTLANLEYLNQGPPLLKIGFKKVVYEKRTFLEWFAGWIKAKNIAAMEKQQKRTCKMAI